LKVVQELGVSHSLVKQISNGTYQHVDSDLYSKVHKALNEISDKRNKIEEIKATL
jgi:DNA replication initiation complex subunit (GINS family)